METHMPSQETSAIKTHSTHITSISRHKHQPLQIVSTTRSNPFIAELSSFSLGESLILILSDLSELAAQEICDSKILFPPLKGGRRGNGQTLL